MKIFIIFKKRWVILTMIAIAAAAVLIRLGFWQLDRLQQRREFNARVLSQINQPVLTLNAQTMALDLMSMEYRTVTVSGQYDHQKQVTLINQAYRNQFGVHLLTPLRIAGTDAYILVDRGWAPAEGDAPGSWAAYDEAGIVEVTGVIRKAQPSRSLLALPTPTLLPGETIQRSWLFADIDQISAAIGLELLPVYVQQAPTPSWTGLPYRTEPDLDLTEGSHQSYALQWFTFALIVIIGYPVYVFREEQKR